MTDRQEYYDWYDREMAECHPQSMMALALQEHREWMESLTDQEYAAHLQRRAEREELWSRCSKQ